MAAAKHAPKFQHVVIDNTAARPERDELEALVDGCDLLVLPTTPEMMAIYAMVQTAELLQELGGDVGGSGSSLFGAVCSGPI